MEQRYALYVSPYSDQHTIFKIIIWIHSRDKSLATSFEHAISYKFLLLFSENKTFNEIRKDMKYKEAFTCFTLGKTLLLQIGLNRSPKKRSTTFSLLQSYSSSSSFYFSYSNQCEYIL